MRQSLIIKEAIKSRGLTINEVAERMGVNRMTLNSHINGNPSVEILGRISDAIGCNITDLFEQDNENVIVCPKCGTRPKVSKE